MNTMRKIVAWVGDKDNKADMPRPGWLDSIHHMNVWT